MKLFFKLNFICRS